MVAQLAAIVPVPQELADRLPTMTPEEIREAVLELVAQQFAAKAEEFTAVKGLAPFGDDPFGFVERQVLLQTIDLLWVDHLTAMEEMREGIGLQAYGQNDPLVMYKREGHDMFEQLKGNIRNLVARNIYHQNIQIRQGPPPPQANGAAAAAPPAAAPASDGNGALPAPEAGSPLPVAPAANGRPAPRLRENREAPVANGGSNGNG